MNAAAVLLNVRALIAAGWCQGSDALDPEGRTVIPGSPAAASWSLLGALGAVAGRPDVALESLAAALGALTAVIDEPSLSRWNDEPGRTQADVLETIDRAAARLHAQAPVSSN